MADQRRKRDPGRSRKLIADAEGGCQHAGTRSGSMAIFEDKVNIVVGLRILEKWFNIAPWENAEYISDNSGEKFWIHWRDKFERAAELHGGYRGGPVGVVNSLREDDNSITLPEFFTQLSFRCKFRR